MVPLMPFELMVAQLAGQALPEPPDRPGRTHVREPISPAAPVGKCCVANEPGYVGGGERCAR